MTDVHLCCHAEETCCLVPIAKMFTKLRNLSFLHSQKLALTSHISGTHFIGVSLYSSNKKVISSYMI
jgi:hypothetical protein